MNEAMCLATDVANEGGHRPKERSRPRGGVDNTPLTLLHILSSLFLVLISVHLLSQYCRAHFLIFQRIRVGSSRA